jgi:hypothetical protein
LEALASNLSQMKTGDYCQFLQQMTGWQDPASYYSTIVFFFGILSDSLFTDHSKSRSSFAFL